MTTALAPRNIASRHPEGHAAHEVQHHPAVYPSRQQLRPCRRQLHGQGQNMLTIMLTMNWILSIFQTSKRIFSHSSLFMKNVTINAKKLPETLDSSISGNLARKEGFEPSRRFYPAYSLSRGAPSASWVLPQIIIKLWRREWDSNPRTLSRRRFSRPVPSTARTSLHEAAGVSVIQALVYDTIPPYSCQQNFERLNSKIF